jgi:hypothetical protein
MAKYRPHIFFAAIMLFYLLVRWYRPMSDSLFIRHHLTDVLFVPAMCLFALIFVRFFKRDNTIVIPWYYVLIQTALISIYFEWYLPTFHGRPGWYTTDWIDVIMYFTGAGIYLLLQRPLTLSKAK